jgi:hypothetical protein
MAEVENRDSHMVHYISDPFMAAINMMIKLVEKKRRAPS